MGRKIVFVGDVICNVFLNYWLILAHLMQMCHVCGLDTCLHAIAMHPITRIVSRWRHSLHPYVCGLRVWLRATHLQSRRAAVQIISAIAAAIVFFYLKVMGWVGLHSYAKSRNRRVLFVPVVLLKHKTCIVQKRQSLIVNLTGFTGKGEDN